MRIFTLIVRVLIGLLLLFASITYALIVWQVVPAPTEPMTDGVMKWNAGAEATVYLMPLVKFIEFVCGVSFVTGFYAPFSTVVIFPITINIFLFHAFLGPESIGAGAALLLGNLYLIYAYRDRYAPMLAR